MTEQELENARSSATGNVASMVMLFQELKGRAGMTIQIEQYSDGDCEYFYRSRLHDLTGTTYGLETVITKDEAIEAKRLRLTPWSIPGVAA